MYIYIYIYIYIHTYIHICVHIVIFPAFFRSFVVHLGPGHGMRGTLAVTIIIIIINV